MSHLLAPKRFVRLIATTLAVLALGIASSAVSARTLQQVLNHGVLRVGVALYAPWAMRDAKGDLRGFEVDVANALAADMGVKAQIVAYDWKKLIPALESDEIDVIAAGMTITPARALHANFSKPYEGSGVTLATNTKTTEDAKTLADLDAARYRFAVVKDSVAARLAARILPSATLETFATDAQASKALVDGKVDGYLAQLPTPRFLALEHPDKIDVPLTQPLLPTRSGFLVNKGDPDFVFFLNAWITARETDTWLPTTHHYWFETLQWRQNNAPLESK